MGIYLPNMEMPTNCEACRFHDGWCLLLPGIAQARNERREDCPLITVQPHGRLIEEADAIKTVWMILNGLGYLKEENPQLEQTVREVFATAPAIEVE